MNVLSLFDGMSCGRIALDRAGIPVTKYYASEIDKYAEKISESNYQDIISLGDITKWREWDIPHPDIILAGSPCQGFSFAGKGLNFNDPRSALFFTFADILRHYKPKYFLLENVKMKAEHQDVISGILGEIYPDCVDQAEMFRTGRLEPVLINSALVSAQNRERLYWCNWKVTQPEDKGILLRDIIETGETDKEKSYCIDANYYKGGNEKSYLEHGRRQLIITGGAFRGRNPEKPKSRETGLETVQKLEMRGDEKTNTLTTVQKDNVCVMIREDFYKNREKERIYTDKSPTIRAVHDVLDVGTCIQIGSAGLNGHESTNRVYSPDGKSPTLTAIQGGNQEPKVSTDSITWRKLTVTECERLQTVPDGFCRAVSKSRAYHALGNGWTVDVIVHILKQMEIEFSKKA